MHLSPDEVVLFQYGFFKINATLAVTWAIMPALALVSWLVTRGIKAGIEISRGQCMLEIIVLGIRKQINEIGLRQPDKYIGFIGSLFLFIAAANLSEIFPFIEPPTGSLSTTAALAVIVAVSAPLFGILENGVGNYLASYLRPSPIMAPFHLISEVTRTVALSVRLFGNMMSGSLILAILLSITPFFFPVVMSLLGILIGVVQAYIFSVLAAVFIAAATSAHQD